MLKNLENVYGKARADAILRAKNMKALELKAIADGASSSASLKTIQAQLAQIQNYSKIYA